MKTITAAILSLYISGCAKTDHRKEAEVTKANLRGIDAYQRKDFNAAYAAYSEACQLDPSNATAFLGRGLANSALGRLDDAIKDYTEAIRLDGGRHEVYFARGRAHALKEKQLSDRAAVADFTEAIRLKPDMAVYYHARGISRAAIGELTESLADFDRALELEPTHDAARDSRDNLLKAMGK